MNKILDRISVVGIGPGLVSQPGPTGIQKILAFNKPVVFDADALNLLADTKS